LSANQFGACRDAVGTRWAVVYTVDGVAGEQTAALTRDRSGQWTSARIALPQRLDWQIGPHLRFARAVARIDGSGEECVVSPPEPWARPIYWRPDYVVRVSVPPVLRWYARLEEPTNLTGVDEVHACLGESSAFSTPLVRVSLDGQT
jgi:hypothetical protein